MDIAITRFGANPFIVSIIASLIFVAGYLFDQYTPLGVAGGLIYIVFVMSGLWYRTAGLLFVFAAIGSIMTIIGYFSIDEIAVENQWIVQLNRMMSVVILWIVAILCYFMKQTLARREAAESRLNAIIENTVDGIITIDQHGIVISFNRACEIIFGYSAEEMIGKNVKILMPPPYHDAHDGYLKHYQDTGERKIIGIGREVEGQRKDGKVFPIDLSVSEVIVGDTIFYSGIVRDITERKAAEEDLNQALSNLRVTNRLLDERTGHLQALLDGAVDGFITIDANGTIQSFNRACQTIFGYRTEEVIGKNVKILMPEPYHDEHDGYLQHYHDTGQKRIIGIGREVEGKRKNGEVFPIDLSVSEVIVGDIVFYSGIVRDITEAKQTRDALFEEKERLRKLLEQNVSLANEIRDREKAEESMRDANAKLKNRTKELAQANEELSQFTFAVSHDLKTPLRAINGYSNWLASDLSDTLDGDQKEYLEGMQEAVGQAERLIDDLLELSRIGRREAPLERIQLTEYLHDLVNVMRLSDDIEIDLAENLPELLVSPTILTQIFQNLIVNGITYNQSSTKRVEIGCRDLEPGYEVFVRDNGIGVDPQFHERIFQIFQRLHTRDEYDGTGVGLAIVKKAVQQIAGNVRVESELGTGSTFFVTIPQWGETT